VRDPALIAAAQRVEHYEMAGYGAARDFAKLLGMSDVASLLEETLEEEKSADKKLTSIATGVNKQAKMAA
jgi:ferritin-like metal-binding protein YciE